MIRVALALLLLSDASDQRGRFERFCSRTDGARSTRGFECNNTALLEAFTPSGAGTFGVCSTTAPTGTKGEALTFSRASSATCTKTAAGGLATTGIANGDLVSLATDKARVEYDSAGTLGLLVEAAGTNLNIQSEDFANAAYTNVGAPTVTANTTTAPDGALTMDTIQDNSAAALEGRQQTITVSAGAPYTLSVYVKAGSLSSVTVSLDGTTATCTSLSATTSTRCIVTDASSSGVSIVAQVLGGTVIGDTGTFIAWGQDVEAGSYATSYIPTVAATVTRAAEAAEFPAVAGLATSGCVAATVTPEWAAGSGPVNFGVVGSGSASTDFLYARGGSNLWVAYDSTNNPTLAAAWVARTALRGGNSWSGSAMTLHNWSASTTTAASFDGVYTNTKLMVGTSGQGGVSAADSIISRIQADPVDTRCGP